MASHDNIQKETAKVVTCVSNEIQKSHSTSRHVVPGSEQSPLTYKVKQGGNSEASTAQCSTDPSTAENYEEEYFSMLHKTHHGSIDLGLDEKLTSMTGSYSEILDDSHQEESESDHAQQCSTGSASSHMDNLQDFCTKLDDKRKGTEVGQGATPKVSTPQPEGATSSPRAPWTDKTHEENVSSLVRDFPEKSSISSTQSSKRKECLMRTVSSSQSLPRSRLYPSVPPVDPTVIADLEDQARNIATSMDTLIENLTGTLHSISALSVDCVETYRDAVCKTCDAVDSNIKSMYQLMAKCEELSKAMKPMYKLHDQIKEIRRLLDLFESVVYSGGT